MVMMGRITALHATEHSDFTTITIYYAIQELGKTNKHAPNYNGMLHPIFFFFFCDECVGMHKKERRRKKRMPNK